MIYCLSLDIYRARTGKPVRNRVNRGLSPIFRHQRRGAGYKFNLLINGFIVVVCTSNVNNTTP